MLERALDPVYLRAYAAFHMLVLALIITIVLFGGGGVGRGRT